MRWFVNRNGETVGPVEAEVVAGWSRAGMGDAFVCEEHGGVWRPIAQSPFSWQSPSMQSQGSGCSTLAILVIATGVLIGGCTAIVVHPVAALAVVFVGIPFAIGVLQVVGALLVPPPR